MTVQNLLRHLTADLAEEAFETLVETDRVRIERIVSKGHVTPAGEWYDQPRSEWVMVLRGAARLLFDDGTERSLGPGDAVDIPARCRHRVSWTDPDRETVWLAVHY